MRQKDKLELALIQKQGIAQLQNDLSKACEAYDSMADDLEAQINDISDITEKVKLATNDREQALQSQIGKDGELNRLRQKVRD